MIDLVSNFTDLVRNTVHQGKVIATFTVIIASLIYIILC